MSIVTEILSSAQGGKLIDNLAHNFGLSTEQTQAAVEALTPALTLGLANAASNPQALEQIVAGLVHPTHQAAFDDHTVAHGEEATELGKDMTAHLFGSSSTAGQIAQIAARDVGVRPDVLSRLLPVLVSVVLGGLFKNFDSRGLAELLAKLAGAGALGTILSQMSSSPAQAAPGDTAPGAPAPAPGGGLGGLLGALLGGGQGGGLLGGLLGSLLGGGAPAASGQAPTPPAGDAGGELQDILGQLIKTLNAPAPAGAPAEQTAELQDVLDKAFPTR